MKIKKINFFFASLLVGIFLFGGFVNAALKDDWNTKNTQSGYSTSAMVTAAYNFMCDYSGPSPCSFKCTSGDFAALDGCQLSTDGQNLPCCDLKCGSSNAIVWNRACALSGIVACYPDLDNDGQGSSGTPIYSVNCWSSNSPYAPGNTDCNSSNANTYTGALEICDGQDNNCNGQVDEGNICSCVVGANYDTITSAGGYWATGCCNPPSSYWGCPPSLGGSNTNPGAGLGTCVSSVWVSTGSTTNYFCSGTSCNTLCSPNSALGCASSCSSINSSYWASLNGLKINNSNLGDTVLLVYGGKGLTGKTVNYSINVYNTSGAVWWNPFSYFSKAWDSSQKILGDAYEPFTLTQTDLHRFNASIVGTNQWNMSNNLTVSSFVNNSLPIAIINSPANDSKVQSGNLVWFNQSSTDEDDLLRITWDFGDGNITSCYNYSVGLDSAKCNIQHTYANKGIYLVKLTVTEMNRVQSSQAMMLIYVFSSGINVVPIISNPKFGISYGNFVDFDASGSYVANCSANSLIRNFTMDYGNLNCTYVHAPNKPSSQSLIGYNLTYSWNMDGSSVSGNWSSYNSAVVFKYYFLNSGAHRTQLNLTYIGS